MLLPWVPCLRRFAFVLSFILFTVLAASTSSAERLKVYTKPIEPFAFQQDGKAMGFSIDLWDRIARDTGLEYDLVWVKSVGEVVDALKSKQGDVGVAAISMTSEREAVVDFSQPFYESGLSILVNAQGQSSARALLQGLFTADFVKLCVGVLVLLVVTAHLVWLFERKRNPEQFPAPYFQGVWESAWWAISTILSGGCDAKGPMVIGGRIVGAFWMLVCIVFITYFTASITSMMTVNQLTSDINGPSDLPGRPVATVKGSTADKYLTARRTDLRTFPTVDEAFTALDKKQVQAVVYDAPVLLYRVKGRPNAQQRVVGRLFEKQNYGIALQQNSPYRKTISSALLKLREEGFLDELQAKWLGEPE
jgi:polar amino acid transport system substrate-binding protein